MNESLAIVLPVRNAQHTLSERVARILEIAAELNPQCEVAIVDDGSSDGTEEVACDLALRYPQVQVARHHRPRSFDDAVHTGVQATRGSVLMIVPPDCDAPANQMRRLWRIATSDDAAQAERRAEESETGARSTVIARLTKWGQALREESARRQHGVRMVRRHLYRRRQLGSGFEPRRLDREATAAPMSPPNFLSHLKDFAFGE